MERHYGKDEQSLYDQWIEAGYGYFAEVGPVRFSVKELSEKAGFSRTSFNYYFGNKEEFFDLLIHAHFNNTREFNRMVRSDARISLENLARWLDEFSVGIRFQHKLFLHRDVEMFDKAYLQTHEISIKNGLLDWMVRYFGLQLSHEQARRVYFMLTDVYYTRCNDIENKPETKLRYSDIFISTFQDFSLLLQQSS